MATFIVIFAASSLLSLLFLIPSASARSASGDANYALAAAASGPVAVMETAGEGGAWGIALLAAYMQRKETGETLEAFLQDKVFAGAKSVRMEPKQEDIAGFEKFMERYRAGLAAERAAVESLALWEED